MNSDLNAAFNAIPTHTRVFKKLYWVDDGIY